MNTHILEGLGSAISAIKTPQTILGLLVIALFAWTRFNTWTDREKAEGYGTGTPPRVYTTWIRYMGCAMVYVLSLEAVYLGFVIVPDLLSILARTLSVDLPEGALVDTSNAPLWILCIMVGLLPHVPGLKEMDAWWRYTVHRRAFIPAEAEALVQQLVVNPDLFRPDPEQAARVLATLTEELPPGVNALDPKALVAHRWFKLSYLRKRIQEWQGQPEVNRFFSSCRKEYVLCDETYTRLRTDVKLYFDREEALAGRRISPADTEYQARRRQLILGEIDRLLVRTFEFISCGILATERSASSRYRAFQRFDLHAQCTQNIPVLWDVIFECAIAVFAITMITTFVFFVSQKTTATTLWTTLRWSGMSLAIQALGICGSVFFYVLVCRRMRPRADAPACGPVVQVSLAGVVGYVIGVATLLLLLQFSSASIPPEKHPDIALSWSLIPAATSAFVVSYLSGLRPGRQWWSEGCVTALGLGAVALLSYGLVTEAAGRSWNVAFAIYAVATCALTGLAIGLIFPAQYRRFLTATYRGPERRIYTRQPSGAASTLRVGSVHYPCDVADISPGGARTTAEVAVGIGTSAVLDLPGLGTLPGVIVRRAERGTCVRFSIDEATRSDLSSYLAQRSHE